jgi:hypothetical protein
MGSWRLETRGYYATAELMGTLDMLQMAGQERTIIEAVLRLEQRSVKRLGTGAGTGTLKFAVPVLWPKFTPRQMLSAAAERGQLLMAPSLEVTPRLLDTASEQAKGLHEHIGDLYGDAATSPGKPLHTLHPIWATIEEWYTLAGRHEKYAEYQVWARKQYRVSQIHDIGEEALSAMALRVYAALEPLIVARHTSDVAPGSTITPESDIPDEGTSGASWGPENPHLMVDDEGDAQEGNDQSPEEGQQP